MVTATALAMALFPWWNRLTRYGSGRGKEERNMLHLVAFDRPGPAGGVISGETDDDRG